MLIDDILTGVKPKSEFESGFLEDLRRATIIKAHNVAQYIFESPPTRWDLERDFPNIAPPFETLWMEWKHRCDWGFSHTTPCSSPVGIPMGIFLLNIDLEETSEFDPRVIDEVKARYPGCRWVTAGYFTWQGKDGNIDCPPGLVWGVMADGSMFSLEKFFQSRPHPLLPYRELSNEEEQVNAVKMAWFLPIPLMALSFMHCKNVQLVKSPPHPLALQKARQRRGRTPLVRWYTLTIDPVRKVVAEANSGNSTLTPKALHKVRGHFKQYDQGALFGKHRGLFWWPEFERGTPSAGVVNKDYRVLAVNSHSGEVNGR